MSVFGGSWSTGWCDCFSDCETLCCTMWCPCVVVGRIAEIVTDGNVESKGACCCHCLLQYCLGVGCCYSCGFRTKLRAKYGLPAEPCGDCCSHWCCTVCSISQDYRELKQRGWEPSDGYQCNVTRFQTSAKMAPPMRQSMPAVPHQQHFVPVVPPQQM